MINVMSLFILRKKIDPTRNIKPKKNLKATPQPKQKET